MRTTIDLDPGALALARSAARTQKVSLGKILSDALFQVYAPNKGQAEIVIDDQGFPTIDIGRPITHVEVKAFLEDEADFPIGTTDLGLPAIYVGRTVTPEDVATAIKDD